MNLWRFCGMFALLGCTSIWEYIPPKIQTNYTQLESGLIREERAFCYHNGSIEMQLNYKMEDGERIFFLSFMRDSGLLYCHETITAVNSMQRYPDMAIFYDDGCDGEVDRISQRLIGLTLERTPEQSRKTREKIPPVLSYRESWGNADAELNDTEFKNLKKDIGTVFDIEQQIRICEEQEF